MKTCKKCKKSLPNNMKICKYCGTDVSKAKIYKYKNKKSKVVKTEFVEKKEEKVNPEETKTEFLFTTDFTNYQEAKKKKTTKKEKDNKKDKVKEQLETIFDENYNMDVDIPELLFVKKVKLQKKAKTKLIKIKKNKNKTNIKKPVQKIKEDETKNKITRAQQLALAKKRDRLCNTMKFLVAFMSVVCILYAGYRLYESISDKGTIIKIEDKDRRKKFKMNEVITYKNISYSITKVETSEGTAYRKPKEGNHFLIITIDMENNSKDKYRYSHNDWKMTNSTGEEQERIISPVNAGRALYSGSLVVGGTKSGSLVFEQPIDEKNLELRYYEPEKEEPKEEEEEIEKPKREPIFSVVIKTN